MRLIIDASIAVAWCAQQQATPTTWAAAAIVSADGALVPAHFPTGLANSLLQLQKRNRLDQERIDSFAETFLDLDVEIDPTSARSALGPISALAQRFGLTIYDAAYLALALRTGLAIATRDQQLAEAAVAAGATLFVP